MGRKINNDELGIKTGLVTVAIKKEKYLKIKKKSEITKISVTQLINDMVTRDLENSEFLKRTAPALSMLSMNEDNVLILDTEKTSKRIAEIVIRNKKYLCLLDDSHICIHIKYMMILPECVKFKNQVDKL